MGYSGVSAISRVCGLSRVTITKGIRELGRSPLPEGRIRRPGGGRWKLVLRDPELTEMLDDLVEPLSRGDPMSPLRWTCKSTRTLAWELTKRWHPVSHEKVAQLLREAGYSLRGNRRTEEGADHPDRDAQFRHINQAVRKALAQGWPVISVGTKKKELVGTFEKGGRQWPQQGKGGRVKGQGFPGPEVPRAYPHGIYDLGQNTGFVNVGTDHDKAGFAVASIGGWWLHEGRHLYPGAADILITTDAGASSGYGLRLWKWELQRLADQTGLSIAVCHIPPGTSKWNKVEHRLFSFITSNWRGGPRRDYQTIVRLIASTTTAKGLTVTCRLDHRHYAAGRAITDGQMAAVNIRPARFHGEWNYLIRPNGPRQL